MTEAYGKSMVVTDYALLAYLIQINKKKNFISVICKKLD